MTEKQTKCPQCSTTYKVSVAQLTVAQGMVCCPKCSNNFNALKNLVRLDRKAITEVKLNTVAEHLHKEDEIHTPQELVTQETHLLDIFERKVEQSNINLRTYLNNLNYFSPEPIDQLPSLNLGDTEAKAQAHRHLVSYGIWTGIGLLVFIVIFSQLALNKPEIIHDSPALTAVFNQGCALLKCTIVDERYNLMTISKVQVQATEKKQTEFSGEITNLFEKSVPVPHLVVNLTEAGQVIATHTLEPKEYLEKNLTTIERIPTQRPFKFKFKLDVDRNSFDNYNLETIKP